MLNENYITKNKLRERELMKIISLSFLNITLEGSGIFMNTEKCQFLKALKVLRIQWYLLRQKISVIVSLI